MDQFDALVIGAGPAGSTAAILLAQAGWSVAMVERHKFPRRKVCGEYLSATNWPLLSMLGIADDFADLAGPPVRQTAVFARAKSVCAELPRPKSNPQRWGRALSREHLDTLLAARAAQLGVAVLQPRRCAELSRAGDEFICQAESRISGLSTELHAKVVIAAHGSWELGGLCTQRLHASPRAGDWLAFKAHFRETGLPSGLMPLLSFPDGYGGMTHCDDGRASLSCCIRRERLERLPRLSGQVAGDAVLAHILDSCTVLRPVLKGAALDGPWLSAGPIQPGLRSGYHEGVFVVGNAAGEAHPVVAEGISMAMQSAWLLTQRLIPQHRTIHEQNVRDQIGRAYSAAYRRCFAPRIYAARMVAEWASRPKLVAATMPFMRACPSLLTFGARLSGKVRLVVASGQSSDESAWSQS